MLDQKVCPGIGHKICGQTMGNYQKVDDWIIKATPPEVGAAETHLILTHINLLALEVVPNAQQNCPSACTLSG
jgi:hypothetical protein